MKFPELNAFILQLVFFYLFLLQMIWNVAIIKQIMKIDLNFDPQTLP